MLYTVMKATFHIRLLMVDKRSHAIQ